MMTPPPCKCGNDIYTIRSSAGTIICTQCEEERQWPEQEDIDKDNANTALLLDQQVGIKVMTAMIQMLRGYDFIEDINNSIEQAIDFNNLLPRMSNMFMTELIMQLENDLKNPNSNLGRTVREVVQEKITQSDQAKAEQQRSFMNVQQQELINQKIQEAYLKSIRGTEALKAASPPTDMLDKAYETLTRTAKHEDLPARKKLVDYVEGMKKSLF